MTNDDIKNTLVNALIAITEEYNFDDCEGVTGTLKNVIDAFGISWDEIYAEYSRRLGR
jgi:hypothetical protein